MDNYFILPHEQIEKYKELENQLFEADSYFMTSEFKFDYLNLIEPVMYVITHPTYYTVVNWLDIIREFEKWYYKEAVSAFSKEIKNYLNKYSLKEIIPSRSKGSMQVHFGISLSKLGDNLEKYGLFLKGTSLEKSKQFWSFLESGHINENQIYLELQNVLLPPSPEIQKINQSIYAGSIKAKIRPCYTNLSAIFRTCRDIDELLNILFASKYIQSSKENKISNIIEEKFCIRGTSYMGRSVVEPSVFLSSSLNPLLYFLIKKGLISAPTQNNLHIHALFEEVSKHKKIYNKHNNRTCKNKKKHLKFDFDISSNEYFLEELPINERLDNNNDICASSKNLSFDESLISVEKNAADAVYTYKIFNNNRKKGILFNRSKNVVLLEKAEAESDLVSVINEYKKWLQTHQTIDSHIINLIDADHIGSSSHNLSDFVFKITPELEKLLIIKNYKPSVHVHDFFFNIKTSNCKSNEVFVEIGESFMAFLWVNHYVLLPCYKRAICLNSSIDIFKEIEAIITENKEYITSNNLQNTNRYIRFLIHGLQRAISAFTPIKSVTELNQGHLELIFYYGYPDLSNSMKSIFRSGLRGFIEKGLKNNKTRNYKSLNFKAIQKRLPTTEQDNWYPWKEAGLTSWYEWLNLLATKSRRLSSSTTRAKINNHFLKFLIQFSEIFNEDIPDSPFGITPRMIISEDPSYFSYKEYVSKLKIKNKSTIFKDIQHLFDVLQEHYPTQWTKANFIYPFPKRCPFPYLKKNQTHRRPIESLHLDEIKNVLLSPNSKGVPTFSWAKNEYCKFKKGDEYPYKKDLLKTEEGHVWWPGTAVILAFLLEVPLRSFQARWLDEGCLDDETYNIKKLKYKKNKLKVSQRYPDLKEHHEKFKLFNGRSGVLQQSPKSFIDSMSETGPSLFINTNKTSIEKNKFEQGYFIPWPHDDENNLPYILIEYMRNFNKKYDPIPKPVNLIIEGERYRSSNRYYLYEKSEDSLLLNKYPYVTPLFRDLTKSSQYTKNISNTIFDNDGNEIVPPLSRQKIASLLEAVSREAERRLIERGYSEEQASMTNTEGKIIYDVHTLRVTGVSRLMAQGVPIEVVRDVVGHATNVMTYYYTVLDQLEIMKKLQKGLSFDLNHFGGVNSNTTSGSEYFANVSADHTTIIHYGGWNESNGGICPSGKCSEGGPTINDDEGNIKEFTPVPGGPQRCGNCRLWISGPSFIPQQAHYIDLVMNEILGISEDRIEAYSLKNNADEEIEKNKLEKKPVPQSLLATSSSLNSKITQFTEALANLWTEWRNRYDMLEASISAIEEQSSKSNGNSLVLIGGEDPKIERNFNSKFGLKRQIANSIVYIKPVTHEVKSVINDLERDMTKLQLQISSKGNNTTLLSHIIDDDLRNRSVALHAQHLYLLMKNEDDNADLRIDKILSNLHQSLPSSEEKGGDALKIWHKVMNQSLKAIIEIPSQDQKKLQKIPFKSNPIKKVTSDE